MKLMTAVKTKEKTNVRKKHLTESKLGYLLILPNYPARLGKSFS